MVFDKVIRGGGWRCAAGRGIHSVIRRVVWARRDLG